MLTDVIVTVRMLVEICLFSLIGQGVLAVLPGVDREKNVFYLVLKTLASPGGAWRGGSRPSSSLTSTSAGWHSSSSPCYGSGLRSQSRSSQA